MNCNGRVSSSKEGFDNGYEAIFGIKEPVAIRQQRTTRPTDHPLVLNLIATQGQLDRASPLYQEALTLARRWGFKGEVIILRGETADFGGSMYHSMPGGRAFPPEECVLVLYEAAYTRGWSRLGNVLLGEAQIAHEIGHLSANLPPGFQTGGPAYGPLDPRKWLKEAAASSEGAELSGISESARGQLLVDARATRRYAELCSQLESAKRVGNHFQMIRIVQEMRGMESK